MLLLEYDQISINLSKPSITLILNLLILLNSQKVTISPVSNIRLISFFTQIFTRIKNEKFVIDLNNLPNLLQTLYSVCVFEY